MGHRLSPKAFFAFAALALGGCSLGAISDSPVQINAMAPTATYRQLVADGSLAKSLRAKSSFAPLEISELTKTVLSQPGDWMACLKTSESDKPLYYAIFFRDGAILDARLGVIIDRCGGGSFSLLPPPTPPPVKKNEAAGKK